MVRLAGVILMFAVCMPTLCGDRWPVLRVLSVSSADSFRCMIAEPLPAQKASTRAIWKRYGVKVRPNALRGVQKESVALQDILKAEDIELRNVIILNPFEIQADVVLGNKTLEDYLAVRSSPLEEPTPVALTREDKELQRPVVSSQVTAAPHEPYSHLEQVADLSEIQSDTPFAEAIEILTHATQPRLPLIVLWQKIEMETGVDRDTAVGFDGLSDMTPRTALELILLGVSAGGPPVGYYVQDGVIVVTSRAAIMQRHVTRMYDITEILAAPADFANEIDSTTPAAGNRNQSSSRQRR